jgi:hypothetical protein
MIKDVAFSKSVKLRYSGKGRYEDRTITAKEKKALQNMIKVYDAFRLSQDIKFKRK